METRSSDLIHGFISRLVEAVLGEPDRVQISVLESESMVVVELQAHRSDVGRIVGREGRMAQAFRVLLTALATKHGKRAVLQILEKGP